MNVARRARLQERPVDGGIGHLLAETRRRQPVEHGRDHQPDRRSSCARVAVRRSARLVGANVARTREAAQVVAIVGGARRPPFRPRRPAGTRRSPHAATADCAYGSPVSGAMTSAIAPPNPDTRSTMRAALPARPGLSSIQMIGLVVRHRRAPPADLRPRAARPRRRALGRAERDRRRRLAIARGLRGEALRHRVRAQQLGAEAVREQVAQVVRLARRWAGPAPAGRLRRRRGARRSSR